MKHFKLIVHQKNFSSEELIVNPKDLPEGVRKGDVVEIYHPADETPRLLLQITAFKEDFQTKDTISVEQSIAQTFQLRTYENVIMNVVSAADVALESVELTFKDQYMGRSEMWRLKNSLINSCAYLNKKIEFCGGSIRCQVNEMYSQGVRVGSGVIKEDTRVVFRSHTSMVYLFLQMSSEMWDFDVHGDLYFEKAVNGFLADLFQKWKKGGSYHEVTIVLFSRTFYEADKLEQFPEYMRECLQQDYRGRFYEDFYRVAVQNERYEEWGSTLVQLRTLFRDYQQLVVDYHKRDDHVIPKAVNSTAAQGNFLEVLNMSLNVFEKHYLDRSFDRTGQLSVVITPGVGVFEVDRQVANITKQRIIDNGVGSDLVCVGEQPLHAVPLLKFHTKDSDGVGDDYSMPHWINLSFYSSNKKIAHCNFIPRIKLPPKKEPSAQAPAAITHEPEEMLPNSIFDYDAYDAQVFQLHNKDRRSSMSPRKNRTEPSKHFHGKGSVTLDGPDPHKLARKLSDPDVHHTGMSGDVELELAVPHHQIHAKVQSGRALINPFDPSHVTIKLTSNRRRWTHIFPKGPTGVLIQQHHYQAVPSESSNVGGRKMKNVAVPAKEDKTLLWGATGEQEWTPALTTGVDWKSLTIPACLPITTDYFPDERSLKNDYSIQFYDLLPDDVNADYAQQRAVYKKPLSTAQVFRELISQRLAQGFQLIVGDKANSMKTTKVSMSEGSNHRDASSSPSLSRTSTPGAAVSSKDNKEEIRLSIGRIFHQLVLSGSCISVTRYFPRHPYPPYNVLYRYRFQAPDHTTYEMSWVSFSTEKLELYGWNYLDHYICTRGDNDFSLLEERARQNLKYWRFRTYILPLSWCASVTKRIMEGGEYCDGYTQPVLADQLALLESFLRFLELYINKLKRPNTQKKPRSPVFGSLLNRRRHSTALVALSSTNTQERHASLGRISTPFPANQITYMRSGSKVGERPTPALENEAEDIIDFKLKLSSSTSEIIEAIKHPTQGVGMFAAHPGLPSSTFSSADAVTWLIQHVEGVNDGNDACAVMARLMQDRLVCHASGNFKHPFIVGFYLYHVVAQDKDAQDSEYCAPLGDIESFQNEWLEVEVRHPYNWRKQPEVTSTPATPTIPPFLAPVIDNECTDATSTNASYHQVHLEMDVAGKSDRVEWGHCRYQSLFLPTRAYELVVQWEAASGAIVADLVSSGWARKAQACGMQMMPLPGDPLALPFTHKSDPLRGPVFIPIDIDCLSDDNTKFIFKDFDEETWTKRLILLLEAIVVRFGFMPTMVEERDSGSHHHHQYVHLTGNMFILIPSQPCSRHRGVVEPQPARTTRSRYRQQAEVVHSPHEEYITRLVNGHRTGQEQGDPKPGFLWFWNHMVSKRWRSTASPATGDEKFQDKMLKDFRLFCSNADGRLRNFWDESRRLLPST